MKSDYDEEDRLINPAKIYDHIEAWWGEDFDDKLVDRILNAPYGHQIAFHATLFPLTEFVDIPDLLPQIPRRVLRPAIATNRLDPNTGDTHLAGLRVLLYAHEIVLDAKRIYDDFDPRAPEQLLAYRTEALKLMVKMRPLVEDRSIKFARMSSVFGSTLEDLQKLLAFPDIAIYLNRYWTELNRDSKTPIHLLDSDIGRARLPFVAFSAFADLSGACQLATAQKAHLLALTAKDQDVLRILLERPVVDNSHVLLHKLAALKVPSMTGDFDSLIALRKSDVAFAQWRKHLGDALGYVGELTDKESVADAADVVYGQLSDGLSQIQKAVKRSPALQALKGGVQGMYLTGISTAATAMVSGDPAKSFAVGSATKIGDVGYQYVKALLARRKDRLIPDVLMLFDQESQASG